MRVAKAVPATVWPCLMFMRGAACRCRSRWPPQNDSRHMRADPDHECTATAIGTVDFWRNTYAQDRLRLQITNYLDDHDLVSLDRQQPVADRLVELARALHARLVT